VLDTGFEPVPIGVAGELFVSGDGLARGYMHPGITAERFLPDPFGPGGGRMYRTGDRVCWRSDGTIDFLGRVDRQVKIRGCRIEPVEIEAAIRSHPEVRDAAIVVLDHRGEKCVVAYVVCGERGEISGAELRDHVRRWLPEYMTPAAWVLVGALPINANGKVDRAALPAPDWDAHEPSEQPRTPLEEAIAGIFRELLSIEAVGIFEDFFGLGGHSLLAMQLASRVREIFQVDLPVRTIFEAPTVAALAAAIESHERSAGLADRIARVLVESE
jgi:acyl carrier protein